MTQAGAGEGGVLLGAIGYRNVVVISAEGPDRSHDIAVLADPTRTRRHYTKPNFVLFGKPVCFVDRGLSMDEHANEHLHLGNALRHFEPNLDQRRRLMPVNGTNSFTAHNVPPISSSIASLSNLTLTKLARYASVPSLNARSQSS